MRRGVRLREASWVFRDTTRRAGMLVFDGISVLMTFGRLIPGKIAWCRCAKFNIRGGWFVDKAGASGLHSYSPLLPEFFGIVNIYLDLSYILCSIVGFSLHLEASVYPFHI